MHNVLRWFLDFQSKFDVTSAFREITTRYRQTFMTRRCICEFPAFRLLSERGQYNETAGADDEYEVAQCTEVLLSRGNCNRGRVVGQEWKKAFWQTRLPSRAAYDRNPTSIGGGRGGEKRPKAACSVIVFDYPRRAAANLFLIKRSPARAVEQRDTREDLREILFIATNEYSVAFSLVLAIFASSFNIGFNNRKERRAVCERMAGEFLSSLL